MKKRDDLEEFTTIRVRKSTVKRLECHRGNRPSMDKTISHLLDLLEC